MAELSWLNLTLGNLSMNKLWGETERSHQTLCTSTLVRTPAGLVLVDPPVPPAEMPALLDRRAGVGVDDIRHIFLTHFHADHRYGLEAFPKATWWISKEEQAFWVGKAEGPDRALLDRTSPATPEPFPGVTLRLTPGHTPGTASLLFRWRERRVAIVGDTVMSEEFFRAREVFHNAVDKTAALASIEFLARAQIVIPGHGAPFEPALEPEPGGMWGGGRKSLPTPPR
ncbi:MAG: MBL fold metallo-hydrolase [Candidatus Coatesbacteria bacterium]